MCLTAHDPWGDKTWQTALISLSDVFPEGKPEGHPDSQS